MSDTNNEAFDGDDVTKRYIARMSAHITERISFDDQHPDYEKHCTSEELPEVLQALHVAIREKTVEIYYKNATTTYVAGKYPVFSFVFRHNNKWVVVHLPEENIIHIVESKIQPSAYYMDEKRLREKFDSYRRVTEKDYYAYPEALTKLRFYTGMMD